MKTSTMIKLAESEAKRLLQGELKNLNTTQLMTFAKFLGEELRLQSTMERMSEIKTDRLTSSEDEFSPENVLS